jgi:glycine hydroxymethyltransferase
MFDSYFYTVDQETEMLDYDNLRKLLLEIRPLVFLIGFSAYTRNVDFEKMREIADEAGAVLMVDMAHFAGLVAGGVMTGKFNPIPYADIVTTTTHKTLRGPRGGMVLCKKEYAEYVDKACPHIMGGPLPHIMAAKAIAFQEANEPEFKQYAANIVKNAKALGESLVSNGMKILTGGTDNHMVIVNVSCLGLTGRQAENALRECGLTLNRNTVPFDTNGPWYTSGLRLGTPAATTLGMGAEEMSKIGDIISTILVNTHPSINKKGEKSKAKYTLDDKIKIESQERVKEILDKFKLYPNIDTGFFEKYF